jgi:periplasmic protein TonB
MKRNSSVLWLSMGVSLVLHLAIAAPFMVVKKWPHKEKKRYAVATLVAVKRAPKKPSNPPAKKPNIEKPVPPKAVVPKPRPEKKPKIKPKPKPKPSEKHKLRPQPSPKQPTKKVTRSLPAANKTKTNAETPKKEAIKPVFGLTRESVQLNGDSSLTARVGNTLMIPQDEAFTPPEQVEDYHAVPPFELSSLPLYRIKVTPEYPESMKAAEMEGQVLLAVTIDERGKVVALKVKRSDNALFAKAAQAALKRCEFTPGTQNGTPVTTTIDIPIKFILDD